jgi:hypothetical protein
MKKQLTQKQITAIMKVYAAAEVMQTLIEQVEGCDYFSGATKNFTKNALNHYGQLSREFCNLTGAEQREMYLQITHEVFQVLNKIEAV